MTPKEKASELFDFYYQCGDCPIGWAKDNSLKVVYEILKAVTNPDETYLMKHSINYWTEVKKEIEAL
jgi:hypothetical protein